MRPCRTIAALIIVAATALAQDATVLATLTAGGLGRQVVGLGDVDGDGVADYAVSGATSATGTIISLHIISGATHGPIQTINSTFTVNTPTDFGTTLRRMDDIDGDGSPEIMVGCAPRYVHQNPMGPDEVYIYKANTGQLLHTVIGQFSKIHAGLGLADVGDHDADGVPDFAHSKTYFLYPVGLIGFVVRSGTSGAVIQSYAIGTEVSDVVSTSDVDGDGLRDFVVATPENLQPPHSWISAISSATGATIWSISPSSGHLYSSQTRAVGIEDVNGDGVDDIAASNYRLGWELRVLSGIDGSIIASASPPIAASPTRIAVIPDTNGDGISEIGVLGYGYLYSQALIYSGDDLRLLHDISSITAGASIRT